MHFRGTASEGENPVVATGFGKGPYTVSVSINYGPTQLERSVEFDGTTDVDMEFDAGGAAGK
jgi:hypothetical protein